MNRSLIAVVSFSALAAAASAQAQEMTMIHEGPASYACGGVGVEGRSEIRALEKEANVALLFATAKRGGYLADVSVDITESKSKYAVIRTTAEGPMCVLRLAPGSYRVQASYEGALRARMVKVPKAEGGSLQRIGFGFPEEPWDGIRADAEEKRQARE